MTTLEMCDRDDTHGLATREIRTRSTHCVSRPIFLCDECANKIDGRGLKDGITVTIEPIGETGG